MANVKVERKASLTRKEVAQALSALAAALDAGSKVEVTMAGLEVSVQVPNEVSTEFEIYDAGLPDVIPRPRGPPAAAAADLPRPAWW